MILNMVFAVLNLYTFIVALPKWSAIFFCLQLNESFAHTRKGKAFEGVHGQKHHTVSTFRLLLQTSTTKRSIKSIIYLKKKHL